MVVCGVGGGKLVDVEPRRVGQRQSAAAGGALAWGSRGGAGGTQRKCALSLLTAGSKDLQQLAVPAKERM